MSDRKGDWIQTASGGQYWPLDPRPEEVRIEDIAAHLAKLCRFTGACQRFYSVAEHSVHVLTVVERTYGHDRRLQRRAILHDSPEAYVNDIARPVKRNIVGYAQIESENWRAIACALGIEPNDDAADAIIKQADNAMLMAEQAAIMAPCNHRWRPENVPEDMQRVAHDIIGEHETVWQQAEVLFLRRYHELAARV